MADLDSLIGCKISLISHQDVRYDGNLFSINQAESSIVLKDVQVFGTEDRVTDPSKKVAASVALIPFVTFPGAEIKDLYVHESQSAPAATESLPQPPAKAATESKPQQQHQQKNQHQQNRQQQHHENRQAPAHPPKAPSAAEEHAKADHTKQESHQQSGQHQNRSQYTVAGTGSHLLRMREKKAHGQPGASNEASTDKSEFNFQEGLSHFKKDEVMASVEENKPNLQKYNKDEFFDHISNDASGLEDAKKNRLTPHEERSLNQDTFGAIALTRYGGRGRGRGGRGGHYGRGGQGGQGGGGGRGGNNYNRGSGGGGGYYNKSSNNEGGDRQHSGGNQQGGGGGRGGGRRYNNYNNQNRNNFNKDNK